MNEAIKQPGSAPNAKRHPAWKRILAAVLILIGLYLLWPKHSSSGGFGRGVDQCFGVDYWKDSAGYAGSGADKASGRWGVDLFGRSAYKSSNVTDAEIIGLMGMTPDAGVDHYCVGLAVPK